MDWERRSLRTGALVLLFAVVLRLASASGLAARVQAMDMTDLVSAFLLLEAGRTVKMPPPEEPTVPTQATEPVLPEVSRDPQLPAVFSREDLGLLEINNLSGYDIDPERILKQTLSWDLTREGPAVLILHTHATESYRNTEGYTETAQFRTLDENCNMLSIGAELARLLEEGGIQVIHDTSLHDGVSYNDAYSNAREAVQEYLQLYPSIRLVLDIHRDAAEDAQGEQIAYTSVLGGETAAQIMIVAGSDAGGLAYPNWRQNLAVGVKLQTILQRNDPGICRPLSLRSQRYNQDLHPAALLIEVGAAGNDRQQALAAVRALAEGILDMAQGTVWDDTADG